MIGEAATRPWGSWQVIDEGDGFKVKRLTVLPGHRVSYQVHQHRSEHWTVVSGTATCTIDGNPVVAAGGECVEVAVGQAHRVANEHDEPLVIIEVQRGGYTGEDDIERLEDDYDRVPARTD